MSFNITEILEKLKAIEGFANRVAETKRLADELAENLVRMKEAINKTINESFMAIADQIDTLRRNMEVMEQVQSSQAASPSSAAPSQAPTARATTPTPTPTATAAPSQAPTARATTPTPTPTATAAPSQAPTAKTATTPAAGIAGPPITSAGQMDDELVALLQKKDMIKSQLTDLRFDYMRGYLGEAEYKAKETKLDSLLEEIEKEIAAKSK